MAAIAFDDATLDRHGVTRDAWETTIAKGAAQGKLEEIKELAGSNFFAVDAAYEGADATFDVPLLKAPGGGGEDVGLPKGTVEITESVAGDPNLLDVEVEVRWWGVGGDRSLAFRTRLSPF